MKIALFGGSFDPPHVAHQMACLYVLETHEVDELWMVPCFQHPFDKRLLPFAHRVAMCELNAQALGPRVRVSTVESELAGPSFTLTTVKALMQRHPEHEFQLVIGADLLRERERWHGAAELLSLVRFIVLGRAGVESGPLRPGRDLFHGHDQGDGPDGGLELPAVSSTLVRSHLAAGTPPSAWLSRPVLAYIREHQLYTQEISSTDGSGVGPGPHHAAV